MKKLLIAILLLPVLAQAQTFKPDYDSKISAEISQPLLLDTVVISKLTKMQLYSNVLGYLSSTFIDSRNVIEMKDADLGEVAFKGTVAKFYPKETIDKKGIKTTEEDKVTLFFKCKIYVKDEKYKIVLSDLEYDALSFIKVRYNLKYPKEVNEQRNNIVVDTSLILINDIAYSLNKKPKSDF